MRLEFGDLSPQHEAIVAGGQVNRLVNGLCSERLPAIDLTHVDLDGGQQRPDDMAAMSADGRTV